MATWTSGGRSISALVGAGWFSFSVPVGVAGVVVGLNRNDTSADPSEIECALSFGAGSCRVVEAGGNKTAPTGYATGDMFHILRTATGEVYYCAGTAPVRVPGLPFDLPGALVYKSDGRCIGDAYLDASLLSAGDRVDDASITHMTVSSPDGTAVLAFAPMVIAASEGSNEGAALAFHRLVASANGEGESGAELSLLPLVMAASEDSHEGAALSFPALGMSGIEGTPALVEGAELSFPRLWLHGVDWGIESAVAELSFQPMVTRGAEGDLAEAVLSFPRMEVFGWESPVAVPAFNITLPAFGNWEMIPDIEEIGEGWEEVFTDGFRMVLEVGEGLEELTHSSITQATLEDVGVGSDATFISDLWVIEDIGEGLDEIVSISTVMMVEEVGEGSEEVFPAGVSSVSLEDVGEGSDATFISASWAIEEIGEGLDETTLSSIAFLEDIGEGLDEVYGSGITQVLVEEVGEGLDEVAYTSISVQTVEEVGEAEDSILLRNSNLTAWVMNSETGGVAWYENWSFTGMCVVGDKVLAIGPEGLAVVGGNTDAGARINAKVAFGFTDFSGYSDSGAPKNSDPQRKRVESFWLGYHATGVLNATVETFGQASYTYTMAARPASSPRNNRIIPGKGLSARYWRITLANTDGCAFEVNNMAADIARSSRRL